MSMDQEMSQALAANSEAAATALFQDNWALYRKVVDHNLLFHREVYGELHRFLEAEVNRPFRFLDIACGDAACSAAALRGTRVSEYGGIDTSAAALALAMTAVEDLHCPAVLEQADLLGGLGGRTADVAWVGLSLHHLRTGQKRAFMHLVRGVVPPDGYLLVYENLTVMVQEYATSEPAPEPRPGPTGIPCALAHWMKSATIRK